ncbi:hypothetical protein FRB93_004754 [Tulasnella sp. JGI-2019a]|nr:hypothetical protein FRB93_004754 [Tulasnella sp. JGI-2019a]
MDEGSIDFSHPTCKGWTLQGLLAINPAKFTNAPRLSVLAHSQDAIRDTIHYHETQDKTPLWNSELLSLEWLRNSCSDERMPVRNLIDGNDAEMTFGEFLEWTTSQSEFAEPGEDKRFYGKDAPCPPEWFQWLSSGVIPPCVVPMGPEDLFSSFEPEERPETLMTYFGIGDTFTPCHKDPCASQGQNLMTYTTPGASSFWFFTASDSWYEVTRYFKHQLEVEVDFESTLLRPEKLAKIGCPIFICEQILGDLVLVPRRSCHQVFNAGGLTIKTSWSRMSVDSLKEALQVECPMYRRLCRPEVYRTKLLCYRFLSFCCDRFPTQGSLPDQDPVVIHHNVNLLKDLIALFDEILVSEYEAEHAQIERYTRQQIPTCDFCGADIFQSFFECSDCTGFEASPVEAYRLCAACYVEGRSCLCRLMKPMQRWSSNALIDERNRAVRVVNAWAVTLDLPTISVIDESFLQRAESCRVFCAAFHLWRCRTDNFEALKVPRRCSLNKGQEVPHDATFECISYCGTCSRGYCFQHALLYRRTHAADDILESRAASKDSYHARHKLCKVEFDKVFGTGYGPGATWTLKGSAPSPDWPVSLNLRLVWAALTFDDCQPIDVEHSVRGWYDRPVAQSAQPKPKSESEEIVGTDEEYEGDEGEHGPRTSPKRRRKSRGGRKASRKRPTKETSRGKYLPGTSARPKRRTHPQEGSSYDDEHLPSSRRKKVARTESEMSMEQHRRVSLGLRTKIELFDYLPSTSASANHTNRGGNFGSKLNSKGDDFSEDGDPLDLIPRSTGSHLPLPSQITFQPPRISAPSERNSMDKAMPPPSLPAASSVYNDQSQGTPTASKHSTTRDSIIQAFATHHRTLVSEQHRFSDAGRDSINETLEQLQSLLGIRPVDLASAGGTLLGVLATRPGSDINGSCASPPSNQTAPGSSTSPYQLRRVASGMTPSLSSGSMGSGLPSSDQSPTRASPSKRYLYPSSLAPP